MEELREETCSTKSKKCCTKAIIILIVCCLISFFIGFYSGSKSSSNKINRRPSVNRPFYPNQRIPNTVSNVRRIPNVQRPPVNINRPNIPNVKGRDIRKANQPNVPKLQNVPKNVQTKNIPSTKTNSKTTK